MFIIFERPSLPQWASCSKQLVDFLLSRALARCLCWVFSPDHQNTCGGGGSHVRLGKKHPAQLHPKKPEVLGKISKKVLMLFWGLCCELH